MDGQHAFHDALAKSQFKPNLARNGYPYGARFREQTSERCGGEARRANLKRKAGYIARSVAETLAYFTVKTDLGAIVAPGLMLDNFISIPDAESLPFYPLVLKLVVCFVKIVSIEDAGDILQTFGNVRISCLLDFLLLHVYCMQHPIKHILT